MKIAKAGTARFSAYDDDKRGILEFLRRAGGPSTPIAAGISFQYARSMSERGDKHNIACVCRGDLGPSGR